VTHDDLVELGERLHAELGLEYYETGAGLKAAPGFLAIYDRFASLCSDEALDTARALGIPDVVEWIVGLRVGRAVAPLEERQLVWEQQARLDLDGVQIPFLRAPIELQNTADRATRLALDRARARVGAAGLNGIRRDRFALEHDMVVALGFGADYVEALGALSGIGLDALGEQADALLARTADLYRDALARLTKLRIGVPMGDLARADTGWTFRADRFDGGFPPSGLIPTATRQMGDMGLDATQGGRITFDTVERPAKQPRAFCVPVRIPDAVYLVIQPCGGHTDYRTFWHELGHAMHFAAVDADRPFHERWLGDNSITEGFAMLWDHLTLDGGWLARYTDMPAGRIADLRFELAVAELYMLRRYAAKLRYELDFHRSDMTAMGARYADLLTDATGFRFPEEDWLCDVDPGFYSARYLRAWQLEAAVAETLRDRFDEDWYRNPRAGVFVAALMARGQAAPAHQLADEVTGSALRFDAAVARLEQTLA